MSINQMLVDLSVSVARLIETMRQDADKLRREAQSLEENIRQMRVRDGSVMTENSASNVRNGLGKFAESLSIGGKAVEDSIQKIVQEYGEDVRPFVEQFLRSDCVLPRTVKETMPPGGFAKNIRAVEKAGAFSMCFK